MKTAEQALIDLLNAARIKAKGELANIGEPCVEIEMKDIRVFTDPQGETHAIIGMDTLVYLVDGVLRRAAR